jgi:outer membrane immunogenic protein
MNDQWAVGGRVGWVALPNLLTFVSAGYTQAHFGGTAFTTSTLEPGVPLGTPTGIFRDGFTPHGWFIGGGDEYAFNWLPVPGLFWKTEYRLSEFDNVSVVNHAVGPNPFWRPHRHTALYNVQQNLGPDHHDLAGLALQLG